MPQYKVTSPDGRQFIVTAPEGASQEDVLAYARNNMPGPPETLSFPYDDPNKEYGNILPLARDKTTREMELAVPEMFRAPIRGMISRGADIMGEGKPVGTTTTSPDELAAVMMVGTQAAPGASAAGAVAKGVRPGAEAAHDAGYVLMPKMANEKPGVVTDALTGLAGKYQTYQLAAEKNADVTKGLAAEALGLPRDTAITDKVLNDIRSKAGTAYQYIADSVSSVKRDTQFDQAAQELGGQNSQAAQYFPNTMNNPQIKQLISDMQFAASFPPRAGLEFVKQLRFEAKHNMMAHGDPQKQALGLAQRQAANAVDDLIERNIERAAYEAAARNEAGPSLDAVNAYKDARRLIAKTYDIETATNTATGEVSALVLSKLQDKGHPLTDELKTIADAATAFPQVMQDVSRFGGAQPWTALDAFGAAGAIASGHPGVAATIVGRPLARATVLSKSRQSAMVKGRPSESPDVRASKAATKALAGAGAGSYDALDQDNAAP